MTTNKILALGFLFTFCFHLTFFGQQAPQPQMGGSGNQQSFSYTPPLPLIPKSSGEIPFYWSFWVFGDGEYWPHKLRPYWHPSKYPTPSAYPVPTPSATHVFPNFPTTYNLTTYLFSRKTDDPPPGQGSNSLPIQINGGNVPFNQAAVIPAGKRVYVEHSQGYYLRAGEESVFAVSYWPVDTCGGEVLLFYNGKLAAPAQSPQPLKIFDQDTVNKPNYATAITPLEQWLSASFFDAIDSTNFGAQYQDVFRWPYNAAYIQWALNGPRAIDGEFRVFPVVRTSDPVQSDKAIALAVLTSDCLPENPIDPDKLRLILGGAIPLSQGSPLKIGGRWVIDVDTIHLRSGEPTDPNRCTIQNICKVSHQKYKITFRLAVSNIGGAVANNVSVQLNPLRSNFSFCKIDSLVGSQPNPNPEYSWHSDTRKLSLLSSLNPQDSFVLYFSMIATMRDTDLSAFLRNEPAVGGEVVFPMPIGSPPEVTGFLNNLIVGENELLTSKSMNTFCSNPCCENATCVSPWWKRALAFMEREWKFIAAGAVVLLLIVAVWKRAAVFKASKQPEDPSAPG